MKAQPDQRAVILGRYIIEHRSTVRAAAQKFGISKSTVHKDVSERLRREDPQLYARVKDILQINKQERHIRGGWQQSGSTVKLRKSAHSALI